ncbi:putative MFS-type transporter [Ceratocystis platani]|uniref:Putative MFS-type transporter n=1 Tax=Ceratocystis fimbriata f. sp. platani TaxID=88771 RepID=A0A0F8B4Q5_CERFI|nr:putative MFS-type transporter [Ceratocystis platani]
MAESSSSTINASAEVGTGTNHHHHHDLENQKPHVPRYSHWNVLLKPHGVSEAVLQHKYPGNGTAESPFVIDWLHVDPHNPQQFSHKRKWGITLLVALATFAVAFDSAAYSGGVRQVIAKFGVSQEVAILGVSLFVLGFAIGPMLWAPLSELYGRQVVFLGTNFCLTAFLGGSIASQNMATLVILRCLAGCFGASTMTNSGGVIADMFSAEERGSATAVFALAPFMGPSLGPIVGGFLGQASGFRWLEALMCIFTGIVWLMVVLMVPETYSPVLLRKRATKLTQLTGKIYVSKLDILRPRKSITEEFKVALVRPWALIFREPIVSLTSVYIAIIYGTLYMLFAAYPIVFQVHRGWSQGIGGLPFLGVLVGMMSGAMYYLWDNRRYMAIVNARGAARPEDRLPPAIIGSFLIPIGMFWFAWTNSPSIHWISCVMGGGVFAAGLVLVFLSMLNYLVDSYVIYAASVLAANSVLRSLFGTAFPLFTTYMYADLGIHWASSIPGFLALACLPCPLLFYKYGESIRLKCKFAAEADAFLKKLMGSDGGSGGDSSEESTSGQAAVGHGAVDGMGGDAADEKRDDRHPSQNGATGTPSLPRELPDRNDLSEKVLERDGNGPSTSA